MLSQQPANPARVTRDGDAQLQLVRRYSKLLRESAAAARSGSAQARRARPSVAGARAQQDHSVLPPERPLDPHTDIINM
jgi:hypothetical protein